MLLVLPVALFYSANSPAYIGSQRLSSTANGTASQDPLNSALIFAFGSTKRSKKSNSNSAHRLWFLRWNLIVDPVAALGSIPVVAAAAFVSPLPVPFPRSLYRLLPLGLVILFYSRVPKTRQR